MPGPGPGARARGQRGQEDSIGCMKFHWDLDVGECGSKLVSQVQSPEEKKLNIKAMQDRFTVKGGALTGDGMGRWAMGEG